MQGRSRQLYSSRRGVLTFPDEIERLQLRILKSFSYAFNGTTRNSRCTQMREPISSIVLEEAFLQDRDQFVAMDDTLRIGDEALIFRQFLVSQGTTEALIKGCLFLKDVSYISRHYHTCITYNHSLLRDEFFTRHFYYNSTL